VLKPQKRGHCSASDRDDLPFANETMLDLSACW
jgi:hypothetical protein